MRDDLELLREELRAEVDRSLRQTGWLRERLADQLTVDLLRKELALTADQNAEAEVR